MDGLDQGPAFIGSGRLSRAVWPSLSSAIVATSRKRFGQSAMPYGSSSSPTLVLASHCELSVPRPASPATESHTHSGYFTRQKQWLQCLVVLPLCTGSLHHLNHCACALWAACPWFQSRGPWFQSQEKRPAYWPAAI